MKIKTESFKFINQRFMKKINLLLIMLLVVSFVSAADYFEENYTASATYRTSTNWPNLEVQKLRYEPYPVNPGEYFDLYIQVENLGTEHTSDATFELLPKYPFYLDSNEKALRTYGQLGDEPIVLEYKIRVDKDAVEGINEIDLKYSIDGTTYWVKKTFDINVQDAQTDFDLVIQEVNDNEVSIALANTGQNVAYSVIVKIPEQEHYKIIGTNGQMVGNLEDGDYTLVGFNLQKTKTNGNNFEVQIDYTDDIGERRTIIKNITINSESVFSARNATMKNGRLSSQTATPYYQTTWFWAAMLVSLYAVSKIWNFTKRKLERRKMQKRKEARNKR